jgi:serine phosphatase RsbU (regulator of sigma subunit)
LIEGDTIYIFSDGYTDLFDSNNEVKISTKRFKEILLGIQDLNMDEQKEFLGNYAENWRKETEQIDVILVIGVRF